MSRETDPVRGLALRLMEDLGRDLLGEPLQARGWSFGYDRARRRLGACHPASRRITLSAARADELAEAEVEDTIRHEIAHAIDWERRGTTNHDATWKAVARACGAWPSRTFKGDLAHADATYEGTCPSCGITVGFYRQPVRAHRCRACHRAGQPAFLRVTHSRSGRVIWPGGEEAGGFAGWAGFEASCPGCGKTVRKARHPRRPQACGACCERHAAGRYDERFRLVFRRPS